MHVDHPHRQPFRLGARQQRWFDVALVTVLLLPVVVLPAAGFRWVELVVAAGQIAPLYWRRSHPVAVFAVVAAASVAQAALLDSPLWSQVAFPVAVYSVARFSTGLAGGVALAVGLVGALVASVDWVRGFGGEITVATVSSYVVTIVVTAWALGTLGPEDATLPAARRQAPPSNQRLWRS